MLALLTAVALVSAVSDVSAELAEFAATPAELVVPAYFVYAVIVWV